MRYRQIFAAVCLAFGLFALASQPLHPSRKIIIESNWNVPPYSYINQNGKPDGYAIELLKTALERRHIPYQIKVSKWSVALDNLRTGRADLSAMVFSNDRAKFYKFGMTLRYPLKVIVCRAGDNRVRKLPDLNGKTVYAEAGSRTLSLLEERGLKIRFVRGNNVVAGLCSLSAGKYDCVFCNEEAALFAMHKFGLENLKIVDVGIPPQEYCVAGNNEQFINMIDETLYAMKRDGTYAKITDRWFKQYEQYRVPAIVYTFLGIFCVLAILLYFINRVLRHRVRFTERLLKQKNEQMTLALHSGGIGVWGYNLENKHLYNIESAWLPKEYFSPDKAASMFHPEDWDSFHAILMNATRGSLPESPRLMRMRMNVNDDKWHYMNMELALLRDAAGRITDVIGTFRDVTDAYATQKALEESARKIDFATKTANIILWEYDCDLQRLIMHNDTITSFSELAKLSVDEFCKFVHHDDVAKVKESEQVMLNREDRSFSIEIRMYPTGGGDGDEIYGTIIGAPFNRDPKTGMVNYYVGVGCDNTDLITIQHHLEQEREKALNADKLKSVFLANMSHEIRTPLNAIVGFSDVLGEEIDPQEKQEYINIINRNSDLLLSLVNEILDLSVIESGSIELKCIDFDLSDLFRVSFTSLKGRNKNPNVELLCEIPYEKCIIYCDQNRIMQILTNFVTNAFKHTVEGYVKMGFRVENDGLRLYVEDSGPGIPQELRTKIFDRFEKLDSFKQGAGLGLSICKAIVDMLKGSIGVDSNPTGGSIFWVLLPIETKCD